MIKQVQNFTRRSGLVSSFATKGPFYYGWVNVIIAAAAMVATLPGRSIGIGLITEPLLHDLNLERVSFGQMNFWATLIGASFNFFCGPAIDRFGVRLVMTVVLMALSLVVFIFTSVTSVALMLIMLILLRGFGQSALSVVSLTVVGKWFVRRLSMAMAIFAVLIGLGFASAIFFTGNAVVQNGWRTTWGGIGWGLLLLAMLSGIFLRRSPESMGLKPDTERDSETEKNPDSQDSKSFTGFTLKEALATPAFWLFGVGSALYNLVIAGVLLFNQSILGELGFDEIVFRNAMIVFMFTGLASNLIAGWMVRRWSIARIMSVAMILVAGYLVSFPHLLTQSQVLVHAAMLSVAGGVVSVVFFTSFGKVFGRPHLGKIQGAAQVLTVFASASGPWLLAAVFDRTGSYFPALYGLTPALITLAIVAWFVRVPKPDDAGRTSFGLTSNPAEA